MLCGGLIERVAALVGVHQAKELFQLIGKVGTRENNKTNKLSLINRHFDVYLYCGDLGVQCCFSQTFPIETCKGLWPAPAAWCWYSSCG